MKLNSVVLALLMTCAIFSCKKSSDEDTQEVVPLKNVRLKKDTRYYYHYDTQGRIVAQDILTNNVATRCFNYTYTDANKIESRIQIAREYYSDNYLRNQFFLYDTNNRLEKIVKKEYDTDNIEHTTDSICLHYEVSGQLSYAIKYKEGYVDSLVYSNFYKSVPMSTLIYRKTRMIDPYELTFEVITKYDQFNNLTKHTSEKLAPSYDSKRETVYTYEFTIAQNALALRNTYGNSHYFSFAMSMWTNDKQGTFTHFQKGNVTTDFIFNCTEKAVFTVQYTTEGFLMFGTDKGTSTCYQGNIFNETYDYKSLIKHETF